MGTNQSHAAQAQGEARQEDIAPIEIKTFVSQDMDLPVKKDSMRKIMAGYEAEDMNEKWDATFKDNTLLLRRSWTGNCIYEVRFKQDGRGGWRITKIFVVDDDEIYRRETVEREVQCCLSLMSALWEINKL